MKNYYIQIRKYPLKNKEVVSFVLEFEGIKQLKEYLKINFPRKSGYKFLVFELKKCIIDDVTKKKVRN